MQLKGKWHLSMVLLRALKALKDETEEFWPFSVGYSFSSYHTHHWGSSSPHFTTDDRKILVCFYINKPNSLYEKSNQNLISCAKFWRNAFLIVLLFSTESELQWPTIIFRRSTAESCLISAGLEEKTIWENAITAEGSFENCLTCLSASFLTVLSGCRNATRSCSSVPKSICNVAISLSFKPPAAVLYFREVDGTFKATHDGGYQIYLVNNKSTRVEKGYHG